MHLCLNLEKIFYSSRVQSTSAAERLLARLAHPPETTMYRYTILQLQQCGSAEKKRIAAVGWFDLKGFLMMIHLKKWVTV